MEPEGHAARRTPRALWLVLVAAIVAAVVAAAVVADVPGRLDSKSEPTPTESADLNRDSDGDGIADRLESAGWRTQNGRVFVTDPENPDTDGEEAGPRSSNPNLQGAFQGVSDPTKVDSDSDLLDDASELDGGFDPWATDTDGDGLDDFEEIEFGSDPLDANVDGDHLNDAEELREGSDPNVYDLTGKQAAHAFTVAFSAGDWE